MFRFGLKAKFSINLLIILLVAMLMLDFVIMMITRQTLMQTEVDKARVAIAAIEAILSTEKSEPLDKNGWSGLAPQLARVFQKSRLACGLIIDSRARHYRWGRNCAAVNNLPAYAANAVAAGKTRIEFIGSKWIFPFAKSQYMVAAAPMSAAAGVQDHASISLVFDLGTAYHSLAKTQKILFYYIFINALLLTFFGVYRLWQITGRPLQKLVKRADEFQPDSDLLFLSDEEENEFNKLSRSLNRMLANIDADKKKLKSTVLSLEEANAELKKTHKDMLRAEKMASVGRLSSGIAHEIGNPIGIVLGYLDLLRQKELADKEKMDYIERAQDEIGRINKIIRELLDFSRPTQDVKEAVSVHAIIEEITEMLRQQPMMKDITLKCNLGADGHFVTADPQRLRQVFLNLLINASDAIGLQTGLAGGNILIESKDILINADDIKQLQIVVADDGAGISEDELNNIFDPFYTTKEPGKGTGLGLSVCFKIMAETGGALRAEAAAGQGTRFILTFPSIERNVTR